MSGRSTKTAGRYGSCSYRWSPADRAGRSTGGQRRTRTSVAPEPRPKGRGHLRRVDAPETNLNIRSPPRPGAQSISGRTLLLRTPLAPVELQKRRVATHERAEPPFVAHIIGQSGYLGRRGRAPDRHSRALSLPARLLRYRAARHSSRWDPAGRPGPPFAYDRVAAGNETPTMRSNTAPVASAWISLSTTSMAQSRRVQLRGL
jgi:hypothetical protein